MTDQKPVSPPKTLTDVMRRLTGGLTSRLGRMFHRLSVHPDTITVIGLLAVAGAAVLISQGEFVWGALVLVIGAPLDALDGAIARAMQRRDKFGAFWDSTLDRYADGFIFMGLAYYYSGEANQTAVLLSMIALLGSILVSYTRARAEGLQVDCKVGLLTRMERIIIVLVMLVTGWVMVGLWILAVGTHITVAQRSWHVRKMLIAKQANQASQGDQAS